MMRDLFYHKGNTGGGVEVKRYLIIGIVMITLVFAGCGKESVPEEITTATETMTEPVAEEAVTEQTSEATVEKETVTESEPVTEDEILMAERSFDEVYQAYADYLKGHPLEQGETVGNYIIRGGPVVYRFDYITNDDIPDLIYGGTEAMHASSIYILTYTEGDDPAESVIQSGPFGSYNAVSYYPGKGIIRTMDSGMGVVGTYYSQINAEGNANRIGYEEHYMDEITEEELESHYYIGEDQEVSEGEYQQYLREMIGEDEPVVFNTWDNQEGYDVLDAEIVENAFQN